MIFNESFMLVSIIPFYLSKHSSGGSGKGNFKGVCKLSNLCITSYPKMNEKNVYSFVAYLTLVK